MPPPNVAPGSPPPPEGGEKKPEGESPPSAAPAPGAPAPGTPGAPAATPVPGAPAGAPVPGAPAAAPAPAPTPAAEPLPPPAPAPVFGPPVQPAFPPGAMDASPDDERTQPPPETTLALELDVGVTGRLGGSSDYDLRRDQSSGMVFGPSVWFAPARLWSVGLAYEHATLGVDRSEAAANTVDVKRSLDAVWVRGRAYPWRTDDVGLYVGLGLGASWQTARGTGTQANGDFVQPSRPFSCSATDGPGFALGGGLGLDVDMTRSLAFVVGVDAAAHRQSGDTIEGCAPGSGSITAVGARLGFAYRFDLDDSPSSPPARVGYAR
ncbi:MAG: hypothetical protein IT377_31300 [Polyangiaceae bacterium]|nr:hypothetical protein [Polyangiaceae bacterium]